ncbi:MAG: aldehyde dehydrogenase family protein [Acidobacteriaceae bacterium]
MRELGDKGFFLAGTETKSKKRITVLAPWDQRELGSVALAGEKQAWEAARLAADASAEMAAMPSYRRSEMLHLVARGIEAEREAFVTGMVAEAGKPAKAAQGEVDRAVLTFRTAAEETLRREGEVMPLDWAAGSEGRWSMMRRFPRGPVLAITPFNFPLNLVAHKLAPAIAVGCPVVLKPAPQTPFTAIRLAELVYKAGDAAGWPKGALSVLHLENEVTQKLAAENEDIRQVSFTGSAKVGWALKQSAGMKPVLLELGGNAGMIVAGDWPEIAGAAKKAVRAATGYAGQSCISVQRVFVEQPIFHRFIDAAVAEAEALQCGDPADEGTDVGPLIRPSDAQRVRDWVREAKSGGAKILAGKNGHGSVVPPVIVTGAKPGMKVLDEEVFGPVMVIERFEKFDEALAAVNRSRYGLQAGLFTRDAGKIFRAYEQLEVGGLVVGDTPTWRMDPMPYGGVKASGLGREGVRYAMEEMTEPRLLVMAL